MAAGLCVSFVAQALLARVLEPELFGKYIFILSWIMVAALLGKAGQEWVVLKAVPVFLQHNQWPEIRFIVERAFKNVAQRATIWAACLVSFGLVLGFIPTPSLAAGSFALVIVLALAEMRKSWLLAHRAIWLSEAPESIVKSLVLLGAALLLLSSGQVVSPEWLLWLNVAATALTAFIATALFMRLYAPNLLRVTPHPVDSRDHILVSRGMWLSTAANIILSSADVIAVGIFHGPVITGIYAVSSRIAALAGAPNTVLMRVTAPLMSAAAGSANFDEVRRISAGYVAITAASSLAIFVVVQFVGEWIIHPLFGAHYLSAKEAAKILIFGQVAVALMGPSGLFMAFSGGALQSAFLSMASAVLGLLLLAILTPLFGPNGAAAAAATALIFKSLVSAVWVRRKFGIDTTFLALRPRS